GETHQAGENSGPRVRAWGFRASVSSWRQCHWYAIRPPGVTTLLNKSLSLSLSRTQAKVAEWGVATAWGERSRVRQPTTAISSGPFEIPSVLRTKSPSNSGRVTW